MKSREDMLQEKFRSNETVPLGKRKEEWADLKIRDAEPKYIWGADQKDTPLVWYDRILTEKSGELFDAVRELNVIESFKYVITYLLDYFQIPMDPETRKEYFSYIHTANLKKIMPMNEASANGFREWLAAACQNKRERAEEFGKVGEETADWGQVRFSQLTAYLSFCVRTQCVKNKFAFPNEDGFWEKYFEKLIKRFCFSGLRDLALGLEMPVEEANMFFRKVLKRSGFNFYSTEEACLYLVLMYGNQGDYFEKFARLMALYESEDHAPVGKELAVKNDAKIHTKDLGRELDSRMSLILSELKAEDNLFCEKNPLLTEWFGWIGAFRRKRKMRTADEEFARQLQEFKEILAKSYDYKIYFEDEAFKKYKATYLARNKKTVVVWYEIGKEIQIPVGTKVKCAVKIGKNTEQAEFEVAGTRENKKEITLSAKEYEWIPVKVRCLEEREKVKALADAKGKKKEWKPGNPPQFVKSSHLTEGFLVETPEYLDVVKAIEVGGKVRFDSDAKSEAGTILVQCPCGTWIKEGTRFYFVEEGLRFDYESVEPANTVVCKVPVRPLTVFEKEKHENDERKADSKVRAKQELQIEEESKSRTVGILSVSSGKSGKLSRYAGNSKNHFVEVNCCQTCFMPKGTILYLEDGGERLVYVTTEDFEQKPFAKATLKLRWLNSEQLWKQKDACSKRDFEDGIEKVLIESGTDFSLNMDGILRIFTPKRMLAYPKMSEQDLWNETKRRINGRNISGVGTGEVDAGMISNNSMLEYLYDAPAGNLKYYQGMKSEGDRFLFNTNLFKETRLTNNVLTTMPDDDERKRNLILTLIFLNYVLQNEEEEDEDDDDFFLEAGVKKQEEYREQTLNEFTYLVDKAMNACGLQTLNGGNPYDAFLAMLLFCDDPFSMFQDIWSERHPFTDYIAIQWPVQDKKEELLAELSDSEGICISSWTVKESGEVYSMKYLDRQKRYHLTLTCQRKGEKKKTAEIWRMETELIPGKDRETLIEIIKNEEGKFSLKK